MFWTHTFYVKGSSENQTSDNKYPGLLPFVYIS